jgi:hypothetical protein
LFVPLSSPLAGRERETVGQLLIGKINVYYAEKKSKMSELESSFVPLM